jgi:hypothetical protein
VGRPAVIRRALVIAAMLMPRLAVSDEATARAAFERGEELRKAGNWVEACPLYESSYRDDPHLGVLLHLAECHEQIGKLATAWSEFTDAAELAHSEKDPREDAAKQEAAALAARLAHVHIIAPPVPIAGLSVHRDEVDITPLLGTDVPIDAGDHDISASAPGYDTWHHKISIIDQPSTATVSIPALIKSPEKPPVTVAASGGTTTEIIRYVPAPTESTPSFEATLGMEAGAKLRNGDPAVLAYRASIGFRIGKRAALGLFVETGSISASGSCGFDMPSAPASSFDFGSHNRFTSCTYVMPGLELAIHVLPTHRIDPVIALAPGFRFGFADWTPYEGMIAGVPQSQMFPAIVAEVRAGADYAPIESYPGWKLGAFVDVSITAFGQEQCDNCSATTDKNGQTFASLLFGARSLLAF